jgi:uncharacterized protein (TIGR02996 family)
MQHTDDIAFQRAILANPSDTTLKLVYADWLQERNDPRADYVRLQVEKRFAFGQRLAELGCGLDPGWVAFMETLSQPFQPLTFRERAPAHPFTEPIGLRGQVAVFESQYRTTDAWDAGLLEDIGFLVNAGWVDCAYGAADGPMFGFVCELSFDHAPLTAREVLTTIKAANFRSEHIPNLDVTAIGYPGYHPHTMNDEIHTDFAEQYMFSREAGDIEDTSTRGLKSYVSDGRLWYVLLHIGEKPTDVVLLAVGKSPNGKRLVGAITSQMCHSLCE